MAQTATSVPHLYALAHGADCAGEHACFYCAAPCDESHPASTYVKSSFTGRPLVVAPGSPWVCAGCVLCLREDAPITLLDGEHRDGQKVRGYSWVLTANSARAATKAHLSLLRTLCLEPPPPPFALVLSDSGQTHQLYRGVVNHDTATTLVVTLEGERVSFRPHELASRLSLAGRICAASGKPALSEPISTRLAMAVLARYRDGEALIDEWARVREAPLSRLAAWLCPNKETCLNDYPSESPGAERPTPAGSAAAAPDPGHPGPSAPARGAGRSRTAGRGKDGGREGDDQGPRQRSLFGDGATLQ